LVDGPTMTTIKCRLFTLFDSRLGSREHCREQFGYEYGSKSSSQFWRCSRSCPHACSISSEYCARLLASEGWFQKAFSPYLLEAPFPVKVPLPTWCFVCCDLLSVSVWCGRLTRLRLFDPRDRFACFLPAHRGKVGQPRSSPPGYEHTSHHTFWVSADFSRIGGWVSPSHSVRWLFKTACDCLS